MAKNDVASLAPGSIRTFSGKEINPLRPDPEQITILDIAHALSLVNRYTGHTPQPYSVAQHSCLVYDQVSTSYKLEALLHDASEAYISDLARPVKSSKKMAFYRQAEFDLMEVISDKFDMDFPTPSAVKEADNVLLHSEIRDFFNISPNGHRTVNFTIEAWSWKTSKLQFIKRCRELGLEVENVVI